MFLFEKRLLLSFGVADYKNFIICHKIIDLINFFRTYCFQILRYFDFQGLYFKNYTNLKEEYSSY